MRTSSRLVLLLASLVLLVAACAGDGGNEADEVIGGDDPAVSAPATICVPGVELVVFVNPAVSDEVVTSIDQRLRDLPGVLDVAYVDRDAAYAEFVELFADQPEVLAGVSPENIPTSFRLTLDSPSTATDVQAVAQGLDGVGQVVVPQAAATTC